MSLDSAHLLELSAPALTAPNLLIEDPPVLVEFRGRQYGCLNAPDPRSLLCALASIEDWQGDLESYVAGRKNAVVRILIAETALASELTLGDVAQRMREYDRSLSDWVYGLSDGPVLQNVERDEKGLLARLRTGFQRRARGDR